MHFFAETTRNCRVCRSPTGPFDSESKGDRHYTLVECSYCGTIQVLEHYDAVSPDYVGLTLEELGRSHIWMNRQHKRDAYQQFMAIAQHAGVPTEAVIADIGCGTGGFGEYCREHNLQYVGCDASAAQVEYAVTRGVDAVRAERIAEFTSLDRISLDTPVIFTLWDVLEHVRAPESLLKDIASRGFKHTHLFVSVPNGGALRWKRLMYRAMGRSLPYIPWEHVFYFTPKSLKFLAESCGFDQTAAGAVQTYRRSLSAGEVIRRAGFSFLGLFPTIAPQIYSLSRLESSRTAHSAPIA